MSIADKVLKNPVQLALAGGGLLLLVYFLGRKTISDVASGVGGIASGNNAATRGTAYEGAGAFGTLGAVVDKTSGGIFSDLGGALGGWLYEVTHSSEYNPKTGLQSKGKILREGANNTDSLWGRLGGVQLRAQ